MTQSTLPRHADPAADAIVRGALAQLHRVEEAATRDADPEAIRKEAGSGESTAGLYEAAVHLCDAGEFRHALPIALALVAHHGEDARFAFLAGSCLQRLAQFDLAIPMYQLALTHDGTHAAAAYRLGEVLLAQGLKQEGRQALELAVELGRGRESARKIQDMAMERMKAGERRKEFV